MDVLDLENIDNGKEWEDDNSCCCACGAEKNPDFPKCFQCSKREQREFDNWIADWQFNSVKWDNKEPF